MKPGEPSAQRRFFSVRDLFVVAALLLIAGVLLGVRQMGRSASTPVAQVYYDAKLVKTVTLNQSLNERFAVPGQPNVVLEVKDGKIRFYSSTCPDQICVKAGFLSRPGMSAACLPNRVAVKIVGGSKTSSNADTYAYG